MSEDNSTAVLSVKGTSGPWIAGGGGPTVKKDKLNDNLLFSCCCARVGPTWSTVCDCYNGVTVARRLVFRKHCKQKVYSIMSELFVLPSFSRFLLDAPFHRTSIITSRTCIPKLTSGS